MRGLREVHIVIDARCIGSTTGRYAEMLIEHLPEASEEDRYTIVTGTDIPKGVIKASGRLSVIRTDIANYSAQEQVTFLRALNSLNADVTHFLMPQQPVLFRKRRVTTFHDMTLLKVRNPHLPRRTVTAKQSVGRFAFKSIARRNDALIAPTEYTKAELVATTGIEATKVVVIPEAGSIRTLSSRPVPSLLGKQYLLYVGRQAPYKNVAMLARVHQRLLATFPDIQLVLVGELDRSANDNRLLFSNQQFTSIQFTGRVSDEQLAWLYANAIAFVCPSYFEGFGLPGLEAMNYGAPVVSSNRTCLPEVYADAALYFDPDADEELHGILCHVLADALLRSELRVKGRKRADQFSWVGMAQVTHDVYRSVYNGSRRHSEAERRGTAGGTDNARELSKSNTGHRRGE